VGADAIRCAKSLALHYFNEWEDIGIRSCGKEKGTKKMSKRVTVLLHALKEGTRDAVS